jgi:putative FmdB family regulatory protein
MSGLAFVAGAPKSGPSMPPESELPMPIYEYECTKCGHFLDALQKISDEPLKHCPSCGAAALKKLLSAPRFRLKGSGWYETDFKDKNRRNIATDDKPTAGTDKKTDKTGGKKTEPPAGGKGDGAKAAKSGGDGS